MQKASRLTVYITLVLVCAIGIFSSYYLSYRGFVSVPNNAFLLQNFDDLDQVKRWDDLKAVHDSLEPIQSPFNKVNITVQRTKYEAMLYPKTVLMVKVKILSEYNDVVFPSIMIIVLDPNERVRGKAFIVFSTEDTLIEKSTEVEYQFYYNIGSYLQGQKLEVIVQLWGSIAQISSLPDGYKVSDTVYGDLPSGDYSYKQLGYWRKDPFKTFPPLLEITSETLLFQPFTITGILLVIITGVYWTRTRGDIAKWLEENIPNYKTYFGYAMVFATVVAFYLLVQLLILT